jgi:diguanylate cyclase (GGDEF)-like protein
VTPRYRRTADLAHWREELLITVLDVSWPLGVMLVAMGTALSVFTNDIATGVTNVAGLVTLFVAYRAKRLSAAVRGGIYLFTLAGVGVSFLLNQAGVFGLLWLGAAPMMAALLISRQVAIGSLLCITTLVFGLSYALDIPLAPVALTNHSGLMWGLLALDFLAINLIITVSTSVMLRRLDQAVHNAQDAEAFQHLLATADHLTGLPNRRALSQRLDELIAQSRGAPAVGALLFIDLDHFKDFIDNYGHLQGDKLLVQIGERLSARVQDESLVARMGGDEFVVLVLAAPGASVDAVRGDAHTMAGTLFESMREPFSLSGGAFHHATISVGISLIGGAGQTPDDVMREADTAMYEAKARGRNQVVGFEPAMRDELLDRMQLENDLELALRSEGLSIAVQSQVDAQGKVVGAEVLARWTHPTRGFISPARFIPLAERSGLIVPLGAWVLERACELLQQMGRRGMGCTLSINISPRQFRQPAFEEQVLSALARHGIEPRQLMLELTESLLVTDHAETIAAMSRLAAAGLRFSIDDFGTGYSSLSYLKKLPLHELKIDRSFVDGLPHDANDVAIVDTILSMARVFGMEVVAEGVETEAQAQFLLEHGCHRLQGYLYCRPQPPDVWLDVCATRPV